MSFAPFQRRLPVLPVHVLVGQQRQLQLHLLLLSSCRLVTTRSCSTTTTQTRSHYTYDGPGRYNDDTTNSSSSSISSTSSSLHRLWQRRNFDQRGFTVGIGGPVGSGKTATVLALCRALQKSAGSNVDLAVVTNDIFTQEDAEFLQRHDALPSSTRIVAVETGGCPHAAIREDVSANLTALEQLTRLLRREQEQTAAKKTATTTNNKTSNQKQAQPQRNSNILLLCESGGDNLAANFSRELADLTLYVIDVAGGDKIPRKGGPGITQSDLLIINKVDLAEAVGADLDVMRRDAHQMRTPKQKANNANANSNSNTQQQMQPGPTLFCAVKHGQGVAEICNFILDNMRTALSLHNSSLSSTLETSDNHSHSHDQVNYDSDGAHSHSHGHHSHSHDHDKQSHQ